MGFVYGSTWVPWPIEIYTASKFPLFYGQNDNINNQLTLNIFKKSTAGWQGYLSLEE